MAAPSDALVTAWYRGAWWLWLLRPVELVFRALAALRRGLYLSGRLRRYRPPVPVVVVGNITVGGTGKTPVVIALIENLKARGINAGVISRGYGASERHSIHRVGTQSTARQCGDEPLLIHQRTGCPCVVGASRAAAARALVEDAAVELILSDDGLQHYALERDMEIVVLDSARGWGNGFCLPAGPLREPISRLRAVDRVLYRGSDDAESGVRYRPVALVHLASGEQRPVAPQSLDGPIHALAGIGQPEQFFATLHQCGFELMAHPFPDHHDYLPAELQALADRPLIMTEKDAVKCRAIAGDNAWYMKIDAQLPPALLDQVAALVRS